MIIKIYNMTEKELHIKNVIDRLLNKELTEAESSKLISKSLRQTQRIKRKYKKDWVNGLIHKLRWKESNHKYDETKYINAIQIIKDKYNDYWPTLASEKLLENYDIKISIPILRREMIRYWIWKSKTRKKETRQFTARERRECYGELVQYDWSYHKWFEWREWTQYQCLLVAVDDATWEITAKFAKNEWIDETFLFWKEYIIKNWKPLSIYLDKYATYKVNYPTATDDKELPTQFWRASKELWIQLIFANTPQAKWRVERMNQTLQDRLVKELRENNINDIETANKFLRDIYLPKINAKLKVKARSLSNLHCSLRQDEINKLDQIFSEHKERKVANDYTIKYGNKYYQLCKSEDKKYKLRQWQKVCVERHLNWEIKISTNWVYIDCNISFDRPEKLNAFWEPRKKWDLFDNKKDDKNEILNISNRDLKEKKAKALALAWEKEDHYYFMN